MNWEHYDTNDLGWKAYRTNCGYPSAKVFENWKEHRGTYYYWVVMINGDVDYKTGYAQTLSGAKSKAEFYLKELLNEMYGLNL